jgi:hypothetical protein
MTTSYGEIPSKFAALKWNLVPSILPTNWSGRLDEICRGVYDSCAEFIEMYRTSPPAFSRAVPPSPAESDNQITYQRFITPLYRDGQNFGGQAFAVGVAESYQPDIPGTG